MRTQKHQPKLMRSYTKRR